MGDDLTPIREVVKGGRYPVPWYGWRYVCNDLLARVDTAEARIAELEAERTAVYAWDDESVIDFVNELLANAPDEYDGDESAELIALRYLRDTEARADAAVAAAQQLADALEALEVRPGQKRDIKRADRLATAALAVWAAHPANRST